MKLRFLLAFFLIFGISNARAAPLSPQTQIELRTLTSQLFAAISARDTAKMRAFWLPKSSDADTLASWLADSRRTEKSRIYQAINFSGWQKWDDADGLRARFRVERTIATVPKTGKPWTTQSAWIVTCRRVGTVWKFETFWPRDADFWKELGKVTTPKTRDEFLGVEWGRDQPAFSPFSQSETELARTMTARLISSYQKRDFKSYVALWHPRTRDLAGVKRNFWSDLAESQQDNFRPFVLRWERKRTQGGKVELKWTARFYWDWKRKSDGAAKSTFTEWRLTLAPSQVPSHPPRFTDRITFYNSYDQAIQDAGAAKRGQLWLDDWEIERATFARAPEILLQNHARAQIQNTLGAFERQDLKTLEAVWQTGQAASFLDFARKDFSEGDQTRFENVRFEHWKRFQDEDGPALQVRTRFNWSWRDLPLSDPPKTTRTSTPQLWIWTLRPDPKAGGAWKISDRWGRSINLLTALKANKTPKAWSQILNEQHEWERETPAPKAQIERARPLTERLFEALRAGDSDAARALWQGTEFSTEATSQLKGRSQNRLEIEREKWTRIEDTDSAAPPCLRARFQVRWSYRDEKNQPGATHEIWDLFFEPDDAIENDVSAWHFTGWRRRYVDLKRELRETTGWYCAWILDGERPALSDDFLFRLYTWNFDLMAKNPKEAREAARGLRTAAQLVGNRAQDGFAHLLSAQISDGYFYKEDPSNYAPALEALEAGRTLTRVGHHVGAAVAWRYFATLSGRAQNPQTALGFHQEALTFVQDAGEPGLEADILNDLGENSEKLGQPDEAAKFYARAQTKAKEANDLPRELSARLDAAVLRINRGEIGPGLSEVLTCQNEAQRAKIPEIEGGINGILGQIYVATGQTDEAIGAYRKALALYEKTGDVLNQLDLISRLTNAHSNRFLTRGSLSATDPDLEGVMAMMTRSAAIVNRMAENKAPDSRAFVRQAAAVMVAQADFMLSWNRAEASISNPAFKKILLDAASNSLNGQVEKMVALRDDEMQAKVLLWQAEALRQKEELPQALAAQEKAATLIKNRADTFGRITSALRRGDILRDLKRPDEAAKSYREAIDFLETQRAGAQDSLLQSGLTGENVTVYQSLAACLLSQKAPGDEILAAVEGARARSLTDMMGQTNKPSSGLSSLQKSRESDLVRSVTQLQLKFDSLSGGQNQAQIAALQTLRGGAPTEEMTPLRQKLSDARRDLEAFRREIFLQNPDLKTKRGQWTPPTLAQIGEKLFRNRPKRRILSFVVSDDKTTLLVLSPGDENGAPARLDSYSIKLSRAQLIAQVQKIRKSLSRPSNVADDWSEFRQKLLGAAQSQLEGAGELVIIPDGPLSALPFAALNDEDGEFLLQKYEISYAPGLSALIAMERPRTNPKNASRVEFLGLSRSDFAEIGMKALPGTGAELDAIAPLFGKNARIAQNSQATKSFARRELPRARFIHLATHGLLNQDAPLYSSVALSPDDSDPDGRLYARDLMQMNLSADLVVLSACETALGQEVRGEGVLGLTWALFVAGAPTSVVTQWSVDDSATATLMPIFYRHLQDGQTSATAMRNAQLALLKARNTRHPAFWAPFIVVGAGD